MCIRDSQIGKELADKVLEGKYSYVVTTHIDKGHVHNHIIFCAADNMEHNKYHDCKQSYYRIRKLSDELCSEHNLSVIILGEMCIRDRGRVIVPVWLFLCVFLRLCAP